MPRKAIGPEAMTPAERAARSREDRKAYVAALEAAVRDAADDMPWTWLDKHAATIARAQGTTAAKPTPAPAPPPKAPTPKAAPKPSPKSTPRPNAPQTLARTTVQPRFRGSSKR
jgi:hypothetical protein